MSELQTETDKNRNEDIDSKIADFMADIDGIVLGKKSNNDSEQSEWKQCFDETTQAIYYWNTKTNDCSWEPPTITSNHHLTEKPTNSTNTDGINKKKKRQQTTVDNKLSKKMKKPCLIAEYASTESESGEEDDIDELLNEVLDKDKIVKQADIYPLFEADCRAAIARLIDLGDKTTEIFTLRIQLQTRLEDCLAGYLSKSYAVSKLEQALIQIDEFEKLRLTSPPLPIVSEPPLTTSEMARLLSLPPPPPPPSPPPLPSSSNEDDTTLQLFYAQLNCDQPNPMSSVSDMEKPSIVTKSEHHHHHHHKDKKSKPAKTLPTDLIQKWAHARQELRGDIDDIDDS